MGEKIREKIRENKPRHLINLIGPSVPSDKTVCLYRFKNPVFSYMITRSSSPIINLRPEPLLAKIGSKATEKTGLLILKWWLFSLLYNPVIMTLPSVEHEATYSPEWSMDICETATEWECRPNCVWFWGKAWPSASSKYNFPFCVPEKKLI